MPLYEYLCPNHHYQEIICSIKDMPTSVPCNQCDEIAHRTFTPSGCYTGNQDGEWIRDALTMFNRKDADPVVARAVKEPTRENVVAAMRHKGYEVAEKECRPAHRETPDEYRQESHHRFMRHWMNKNRIEVSTR